MNKLIHLFLALAAVLPVMAAPPATDDIYLLRWDGDSWERALVSPPANSLLGWNGSKQPVALAVSGFEAAGSAAAAQAYAVQRGNHTGTQAIGTITGTGPFATGTNAANLTGTLAAARIADGSLTIAKVASLQTTLDGKANLAGGNTWSGVQTVDAITVNGLSSYPDTATVSLTAASRDTWLTALGGAAPTGTGGLVRSGGNIGAATGSSLTLSSGLTIGSAETLSWSGRVNVVALGNTVLRVTNSGNARGYTLDGDIDGLLKLRNRANTADASLSALNLTASGTVTAGNLTLSPSAAVTPANNGNLVMEATSNTQLTFRYKGSDGVVRSATLTLAP
ncbi:hypothetical protein OKA04_23410 [Luteolibacter flavescens]|uniref:Uncharacterized protein n=1 Tax=Luteolibacter flavescens TaxID=1859460 RepID=A0ABT3FVU9_9BACT|nr:hypothetical protein [Luteolibacter flavescens]MCW1887705.1 hypothetical protein [Luteolibacter flavescens]